MLLAAHRPNNNDIFRPKGLTLRVNANIVCGNTRSNTVSVWGPGRPSSIQRLTETVGGGLC